MQKRGRARLSGAAAGLVNGLFGGGGGIPLFLLLTRFLGLEERNAFATCVAVIFPFCLVSAGLYFLNGSVSLAAALPYLLGGLAGGLIGGLTYGKIPVLWLRRLFALFLLYGAYRYLFFA